MSGVLVVLGLTLGAGAGVAFTKAWHYRFLADGFAYLASLRRTNVTDYEVSRAFGSLRPLRHSSARTVPGTAPGGDDTGRTT